MSENVIRRQLTNNLAAIHQQIADACRRSERNAEDVQLVAVSKYTPLDVVRELITIETLPLGENRPQQLVERSTQIESTVEWHLIGQLQRNKVRAVLPHVSLIHSIDSVRLLEKVNTVAAELSTVPEILLQINVTGEASKSGFSVAEFQSLLPSLRDYQNVSFRGLMTMAPLTDDQAVIRSAFAELRELRDTAHRAFELPNFDQLSMGMSQDFEIAIEEGATFIRLGSSIFANCQPED